MNLGSFRILLPFFRTSWGVSVLNSAIFKLIRMLELNTKHFPLNLHSGLILNTAQERCLYIEIGSATPCRFHTDQWRTKGFCSEGGSTNSVEDRGQRERGSGGGRPLVRGSGGSCNLVQEV